ncbi:branched-chain amino acid transport system ATP-binding protein [Roseivivax halotolerans]|jgi:branched-chain amino acid transport system ATP-binding protein|uniref:Branched-chain amino acid transport system ATP-binding protein n=1 Tax=Roseivivax halotolerans TaxID=93684 RepID=A0A1I5XAB4_9RHOB|nr:MULTISPECIES: ABC transporter ATP-binding protein [Roseivivax]QFT63563.1 High-affinity branched-chain amino acid transport ATP-binding protein LivF [Roseivivax sp. THAF30]SFQ28919.1 branched-chain amino acid transport system ATP-binding protein [Roseivivax halotolerans]
MSLLEIRDLTASYGVTQALHGVDLSIDAGEIVALMGRNGMGKTTTVKAICRIIASEGTLRLGGTDLHRLPSHRAARLGIGLVPEGRRCFRDLTVSENLVATARPGEWTQARVEELLPKLGQRRDQRAASLSGGEQQMLAIGRALMTNPRLLILDEATEGLAPLVRQEIWQAIAELGHSSGMAILVIDKALREMARIASRAVILERGRSVWSGRMDALDEETARRLIGV